MKTTWSDTINNFSPKKHATFNRNNSAANISMEQSSPEPEPEPKESSGEILLSWHPLHPLTHVFLRANLFTCTGCKEQGAGHRFACLVCNVHLHDFCAIAPAWIQNHPFHPHHLLDFLAKPAGSRIFRPRCNVCSKAVRGYTFACNYGHSFLMHPSCTQFGLELDHPSHPHPLVISFSSLEGESCGSCGTERSGWFYRCNVCGYAMHAVCAKDAVTGLYEGGIRLPVRSSGILASAARTAAHMVSGLLGGLIEGLGEGIGEAIVENIGKEARANPLGHKKSCRNESAG